MFLVNKKQLLIVLMRKLFVPFVKMYIFVFSKGRVPETV